MSRDFHLYTFDHVARLPSPVIRRVLTRVAADRGYDLRTTSPVYSPDIATIWSYSAVLDTPSALTLALSILPTLYHLSPQHPLCQIPSLSNVHQNAWDFLTTLSLDGIDDLVNDTTIQSVRHCVHLTVLRTRGCKITDTSVRLLAGALDLPHRRGMCHLRAWFMPGCRSISDGSMRSLARWPGLVAIDLRDTSVTESGLDVFNRYSRLYFAGANADMQPCTPGLEAIFSAPPADTLDLLRSTLMPGRQYSALHIVPNPLTASSRPESKPAEEGVRHPEVGTLIGRSATVKVNYVRAQLSPALPIQGAPSSRVKKTTFAYKKGGFVPCGTPSKRHSDVRHQMVRMVNCEWEQLVWTSHRSSCSSTIRMKATRDPRVSTQVQADSSRQTRLDAAQAHPDAGQSGKRRRFDAPASAKPTRRGMKMFAKPP